MLTAIINYKLNNKAIQLKECFQKHCTAITIDSGSGLNDSEKKLFDISLDNVYYCGMINAIGDYVRSSNKRYEFVYVIASDVDVQDHELIINKAKEAFKDEKIGVYGPSVNKGGSPHPQMINKGKKNLRKALFIDGYCFAVRTKLLLELCPIDTRINYIGWGIDVHLSCLAIKNGLITVVDDHVIIEHKPSENQVFRKDARKQRNAWYQQLSKKDRLYRRLTAIEFLKNEFGTLLINSLPWK